MSSTSVTRAVQYWSPSLSPAWRARRAFSPREAWKIEIDLDSEIVRSRNRGLWRAFWTASCGARAYVRRWRAARRPAARRTGRRLAAVSGWPAQLSAVEGLALAEQKVVRFALELLAILEAEGTGAWSPLAAW